MYMLGSMTITKIFCMFFSFIHESFLIVHYKETCLDALWSWHSSGQGLQLKVFAKSQGLFHLLTHYCSARQCVVRTEGGRSQWVMLFWAGETTCAWSGKPGDASPEGCYWSWISTSGEEIHRFKWVWVVCR